MKKPLLEVQKGLVKSVSPRLIFQKITVSSAGISTGSCCR